MAFRKVSGKFKYVKYAETKAGAVIAEGYYRGTREGNFGPQHQIKGEDGEVTVLNSSGHLNFHLENNVSPGDYIKVTYLGMETLTKGKFKGKEMHQFEVEVDDDRRSTTPTTTESDVEEVNEDDEDLDEETEEKAEEPAPKAAVAKSLVKGKISKEELMAQYRSKRGA